jgi:hypothetical protein
VTLFHLVLAGSVRCVQVIPSALVAASAVSVATATNVPLPYATLRHGEVVGSVLCVATNPLESLFCH